MQIAEYCTFTVCSTVCGRLTTHINQNKRFESAAWMSAYLNVIAHAAHFIQKRILFQMHYDNQIGPTQMKSVCLPKCFRDFLPQS